MLRRSHEQFQNDKKFISCILDPKSSDCKNMVDLTSKPCSMYDLYGGGCNDGVSKSCKATYKNQQWPTKTGHSCDYEIENYLGGEAKFTLKEAVCMTLPKERICAAPAFSKMCKKTDCM